ncbi:putative oxidoreductase protein [Fulvimarina pelagi HTCC2506]|uniref:Putative oxidoreductase protein n=1 Tax=Fulvimarina pelagi HTCC2506 TaxID=314231 RepID=Q0G4U6_9HYPH|nr:SDR family oxidoreductase [Fulvimarina pelagi]EAU43318.1 putative oxidoreductase protein [Fulvimarina pelagi HTCC2506]
MSRAFSETLFRGKTVVVTGAGRGIGAAVAATFLACGARVIAHVGRSLDQVEADLLERVPPGERERLSLFTGDLSKPDSGRALGEQIAVEANGPIHALINNAGTMEGRFKAASVTRAEFDRVVDLNVRSVVELTTALLGPLKQARGAAIVNTSSISATVGGSPGSSLYSASKAFISTWTRALARELAPDLIRVNAVSPGTIMTDFHRRYSSEEKLAKTASSIPLARLGEADDCAPAYIFLAAPELSGYVTGQIVEINGGQFMG